MIGFLDAQPLRWVGVFLLLGAVLMVAVVWLMERWEQATRTVDRAVASLDRPCEDGRGGFVAGANDCECGAPSTEVVVSWNGAWLIECCHRCAVRICVPVPGELGSAGEVSS